MHHLDKKHVIPDWLRAVVSLSLVSEVYPELRGVAVSYRKKKLIVYFYLYREPTSFDYESADEIMTNISDHLGCDFDKVEEFIDKCIYDNSPIRELDSLDGFVYLRREHDMEDNPS